jgi:membrane protein implicated in regulation of membrane protease activity
MSDPWEMTRVVDSCARYWRETGVPRRAAAEMRLELEQHLQEAITNGASVGSVVGPNLSEFAEAWASEYRRRPGKETWEEVASGRRARQRAVRRDMIVNSVAVLAVVTAVALAGNGGEQVENEVWRWLWTVMAVVMGIGEIFTAGFFLLPFAIGAAAAAVLAWIGVALLPQWLVFFGVSLFALVYLRRFIAHQDSGDQPQVGANRWVNATGVVLENIEPTAGSGMVRIGSEEWRATTDGAPIASGTLIRVQEVRGARLVVTPAEED